jgi:hypothetical protein
VTRINAVIESDRSEVIKEFLWRERLVWNSQPDRISHGGGPFVSSYRLGPQARKEVLPDLRHPVGERLCRRSVPVEVAHRFRWLRGRTKNGWSDSIRFHVPVSA